MLNIYLQKTVLILSRSCNYMYWNILGYDLYASAMMSMLRPIGYDLYSQTPKRWSLCSDPSALISMLRPLGYDLYAQTHWLWSLFSDLYAQTHWLRSLLLRPIGYDLYAKTSSRLFPMFSMLQVKNIVYWIVPDRPTTPAGRWTFPERARQLTCSSSPPTGTLGEGKGEEIASPDSWVKSSCLIEELAVEQPNLKTYK